MISERELLDQREKEEFTRIRGHEPSVEKAFREYRDNVWNSVDSMLSKAEPFVSSGLGCTGLALGYVQSGKTTSIVGLLAAACDAGYRLIIGLIAVNDNLLEQNAKRILGKLGIIEDGRRVWYTSVQGSQPAEDDEILKNIEQRGRTVLILVLKNKPQIEKISNLLDKLDSTKHKVLVVDDEADQVSLNTKIKSGSQSPTYESIINLRKKLHGHLYIQYTATPYANLLLTPDDTLAPDFVEILTPGRGYTGGRSFFVDQGDTTFRSIGNETLREAPSRVPPNLERALANYLVGSTLMFCNEGDEQTRQTSMLINVHQENLVQEGYKSLIEKHIAAWTVLIEQVTQISDLPEVFQTQYADLVKTGVDEPLEYLFIRQLKHLLTEVNVWLINQKMKGRIRWGDYKLHILIGANKLDRGFTVEGLTVTYMSRRESDQIDTMQQRSRAYGYRPYLKYCRIFTNNATRKILKDTVHTEEDLREQLYQWMQSGRNFKEWANEIGLIISKNAKPTRGSVVKELLTRNLGSWFFLLKSNTDDDTLDYNLNLLKQIGLIDAERQQFGSQAHRHVVVEPHQAVELLAKWRVDLVPKWNEEAPLIRRTLLSPEPTKDIEHLDLPKERKIQMLLIAESGAGKQRTRSEWSPTMGLDPSDLFQNRNAEYPGDRNLFDESDGLIQVHQISISKAVPDAPSRPLYFLAIRLGKEWKSARRGGQ